MRSSPHLTIITLCLESADTQGYNPPHKQGRRKGRDREEEAGSRPQGGWPEGRKGASAPKAKESLGLFPPRPQPGLSGPRDAQAGRWAGGPKGADAEGQYLRRFPSVSRCHHCRRWLGPPSLLAIDLLRQEGDAVTDSHKARPPRPSLTFPS